VPAFDPEQARRTQQPPVFSTTHWSAKLYERRWVTTLFDKVLARLGQEFRESGKGVLFEGLKGSPRITFPVTLRSFRLRTDGKQ
jgi:hypothetical protein